MNSEPFARSNRVVLLLALVGSLACLRPAQAQPTIVSTVPANGATGVSRTTTIVFTFSEEMDTNATSAIFYDSSFNIYTTTDSWNPANTVLTCTPDFAFPSNTVINWAVSGQNTNGDSLGGFPIGSFTTGTGSGGGGGGGGGSGTNAITTFSVGKVHHYNQTTSGPPTLDPATPYDFSGVTALSSNRTATNITLTLPTAAVSNMTQIPQQPELYVSYGVDTILSNYDATFPSGDYSFQVKSVSSNQTVVVNLPTTNFMAQPGAPHLTNFLAAQTIDPGQTCVLGWDAFPGGTASDYIDVDIGTVYGSPNPGLPGALAGTARTFTIPANTLQPNSTYASRVGFFRHVGATNAVYATAAYRATYTEFSVTTTGGSVSGPLILTNAVYAPGTFNFDVLCSTGQFVIVEYKTNLSSVSWQTLLTTNSQGSRFNVVAPQAATNRSIFFRARNGS